MSDAYVVGHITVKNAQMWAEYRSKVPQTLAPWGAELVFRGRQAGNKELPPALLPKTAPPEQGQH